MQGGITDGVGPTVKQIRKRGIPAGRWGEVEDISLTAVFMCSSAASWITATRLTIDGGSVHKVMGFVEIKDMILAKSKKERASTKGGVGAGGAAAAAGIAKL
jgi:hypothetical protein